MKCSFELLQFSGSWLNFCCTDLMFCGWEGEKKKFFLSLFKFRAHRGYEHCCYGRRKRFVKISVKARFGAQSKGNFNNKPRMESENPEHALWFVAEGKWTMK